jgi:hypothetical protein
MSIIDENGQPNPSFNLGHRTVRTDAELMGLCKGVLSDGVVTESESAFLLEWFTANPEAATAWPGGVLLERLRAIHEDGVVEPSELEDLKALLGQITGMSGAGPVTPQNLSSTLPLDDPAPAVDFGGKSFCFTGALVSGPRKNAEALVAARGGKVRGNVTQDLDYLVIGVVASRDWKTTAFGNKILKAVEFKSKGRNVNIISEETFLAGI